ncbi:hypothetical protein ACOME3_010752 [Neoechinorhynchus agilis]
MGKGYENYMSKKWFHPSNLGNMKRLWMAEQKAEAERLQQQLLKEQHDKEKEMFANRWLLGDEKGRLGLSFMYNPPIGMTADDGGKDGGEELHVSNGPNPMIKDVRCIKCQQRGQADKDSSDEQGPSSGDMSNMELLEKMKKDGLPMRKGAISRDLVVGKFCCLNILEELFK